MKKFQFFEKKLFRRIFRVRGNPHKALFYKGKQQSMGMGIMRCEQEEKCPESSQKPKNQKETWKFNSKIDKNTMTLTADPKCKQYEDAWIIFQYSLLYRTVFQAIDGMNKKTAAFLLLRQSQKEGIYIVNVFKTKGRDRQNSLPVKYEKVYFVPGLLSCYALQDTGKMCRNIVFDVKKLWNRCRIECSPGRKLLFRAWVFWSGNYGEKEGGEDRADQDW